MAKDHPEYEDDIPQFSGKINEKLVEWCLWRETVGGSAQV